MTGVSSIGNLQGAGLNINAPYLQVPEHRQAVLWKVTAVR
jgi:hypothetical protein